jgi:hypothetical protein
MRPLIASSLKKSTQSFLSSLYPTMSPDPFFACCQCTYVSGEEKERKRIEVPMGIKKVRWKKVRVKMRAMRV